ncbi:MAG: NAD(P)/FAD-dependent oxidoreductase [Halocynthiibacter sp.]
MKYDFIIIGGGIAGISAAARLSHHGRVLLLEMEASLAYHTSARSAALFEESYGLPETVELNRASRDDHMHKNGGVLSDRGVLLVARSDEKEAFLADSEKMYLQQITVAEAKAMVPVLDETVVSFASLHESAWDIDTDLLMQNELREMRQNGGEAKTKAPVTAIARTASGWDVTTPLGVFQGSKIVNAAGAWVDHIAGLAGVDPIGIRPLRRSVARVPAPDGLDVSTWPMLFGADESWYCKPDAGALIVSPAEEELMPPMDAWPEDMVLAEGIARFEAVTTIEVTRMLSSWAGLRSFAPDKRLVLGPDPAEPDFIWCAGQGGYGFQSSPAASRLLCDLTIGNASEFSEKTVAAMRPDRLRK